MRTKALILAVPEGQFHGPRVSLDDGQRWRLNAEGDYTGTVIVTKASEQRSLPLVHQMEVEDVDVVEIDVKVLSGLLSVEAVCVG